MPSILEKLIGRKKVEEFDAALGEIEAEIEAKQARAIELRSQVAAAAFDAGADKVRELQREARDLEDDIVVLQAVAAETVKRRQQADIDHRKEAVEKRQTAAEKARRDLVLQWAAFDGLVAELGATIGRMQELAENIRVGNEFARIQGFPDLQFRLPGTNFQNLQQAVNQLRQSSQSATLVELERSGRLRLT